MPERPRFYDWMSVRDVGWFTASFHKPGFLDRFKQWADKLGLDPAKRLKDLSKGGYARVGLALALATAQAALAAELALPPAQAVPWGPTVRGRWGATEPSPWGVLRCRATWSGRSPWRSIR